MSSPSPVRQRIEQILDEIQEMINQASENPNPVLSKAARIRLTREEGYVRRRLAEIPVSETSSPGSGFRKFFGLSLLKKALERFLREEDEDCCLLEARQLHISVKDEINVKRRARLSRSLSGMESARTNNTPAPNRRRPAPPTPRQATRPASLVISIETTGNSVSGSYRPSSVRSPTPLPSPSPNQPRTPPSQTSHSFSLPPSPRAPLDPALMSSIMALASSLAKQAHASQQGHGGSNSSTSRSNCVEIRDSTVEGMTLNNGGSGNTGAVINKVVSPPESLPVPLV